MTRLLEGMDIRKSFRTQAGDLHVLKGITLSIDRGEIIGIIGASGAGKSTLLHILGALDKPTSGKILFDREDLSAMDEQKLARFRNTSIGFVFQFHHLLPEFTSIENVMMPGFISGSPIEQLEKDARELLSVLGLEHRGHHRPGELSGGEQQRVAVARALIQKPKIVFADEPTGNLDAATGNELFELLLGLNRAMGTTFVIVTHNKSLADRCTRVIEMSDGSILL